MPKVASRTIAGVPRPRLRGSSAAGPFAAFPAAGRKRSASSRNSSAATAIATIAPRHPNRSVSHVAIGTPPTVASVKPAKTMARTAPRRSPGTDAMASAALVGAINAPPRAAATRATSRLENSAASAVQIRDAVRITVPATIRCRGETHRPSVNCAIGAAIANVAAKAVTSQPAAPGAVARSLVSAGPTPRMLSDVVPITNMPRARVQGTILLKSDCIWLPLRSETDHEGPSDSATPSFSQKSIHRRAGSSSIANKAADAAQHNRHKKCPL